MTEAEWLSCSDPHAMLKYLMDRPRSLKQRVTAWFGVWPEQVSARKLRLFAVACCRRIWDLLVDQRSRFAVEVCERYADDQASRSEMKQAAAAALAAAVDTAGPRFAASRWMAIARARATEAAVGAVDPKHHVHEAAAQAREAVRALTRDVKSATPLELPRPAVVPPLTEWVGLTQAQDSSASSSSIRKHVPEQTDSGEKAWLAERQLQADLVRDIFGNPFRPVSMNRSWVTDAVKALAQTIYTERSFERLPELAQALEEAGCTDAEVLSHCRTAGAHVRGCWVTDGLLGKQ